jgi:DNA processing protein
MEYPERVYMVALNKLFTYEPAFARELIAQAGSASAIFTLLRNDFMGVLRKKSEGAGVVSYETLAADAFEELRWAESCGISVMFCNEPLSGYPSQLLECEDHPLVIYKKGNLTLDNLRFLGVVGTRRATQYGREACKRIIGDIAIQLPGTVIVSGLAFGIDIEAHKAAMDNGLPTVAVLGCGPESIYPSSHARYSASLMKNGAFLTEFPKKSCNHKINFLRRNRIIAGLCEGMLVIESAADGGSMITASLSNGYNREVFALPGRLGDKMSQGCNDLIAQNKATIFTSVKALAAQLGWKSMQPVGTAVQKSMLDPQGSDKEKILVALSSENEYGVDSIAAQTSIPVGKLLSLLLELELEGRIYSLPGKRYSAL